MKCFNPLDFTLEVQRQQWKSFDNKVTNCRESEQHLGEKIVHLVVLRSKFKTAHYFALPLKIGKILLTEAQEFASLALLHCSYKCSITSWKISFPDNIFLQARLPLWRFSPLSFSKGSSKDTTSMTYYSTLVENHQRSLIALFIVRWDFMDRFSTTVCLLFNLFNLQKKVTLQVNLSMQSFEVSKENIISKAWNALKLKGIKFPSKIQNSAFLMASFCVG